VVSTPLKNIRQNGIISQKFGVKIPKICETTTQINMKDTSIPPFISATFIGKGFFSRTKTTWWFFTNPSEKVSRQTGS